MITKREARMIAEELFSMIRKDLQSAMTEVAVESADKYMSVKEAAEMLGWSVRTLYNNIKDIPHVKVGKHLRFSEQSLRRYINRK